MEREESFRQAAELVQDKEKMTQAMTLDLLLLEMVENTQINDKERMLLWL